MTTITTRERAEKAHLTLPQSLHFAAKHYPGGIGALAGAYGFNAHTLQNKLNPTQPACANLEEFEAILETTRSPLILDAIGRLVNCTWIDLGPFSDVGDMAVLETVTRLVQSVGQLTGDLQTAIADGTVSQRELNRLEEDFKMLCAAGHSVIERAKQMM